MVDAYSECSKTAYNSQSESLLQKWNVPITHLDFEYINKCNDSKELERIVRILRSGQEGHYPDLQKCAEERLNVVNPKSKALLVSKPILNKFTCEAEDWNNVCQDIQNWQEEVSVIDDDLQESKNLKIKTNLPNVRKVKEKEKSTNENTKPKVNRIKSWDYAAWDKYDPDVELVREQLEEEKFKKEKLKKEAQEKLQSLHKKKKSVCFDTTESLTEIESLILSNHEKDLGNECFKANDFEEAKRYYTNSIKLRPTATAYNNRCITNIKLKNYKEALDDCEQVLRREPENAKALFRKAQAYNDLKEYNNAFDTLDKLIEIDPNNTSAQSLINDLRNKVTDIKSPQKQRLTIEEIDDDGNVINNEATPIPKTKKIVVPIPSTSKFQGPNVKIMEVTEPIKDNVKIYDFKNLSNNKSTKKLQIKPKSNMSPKIVEIDKIECNSNTYISPKIVKIESDISSITNSNDDFKPEISNMKHDANIETEGNVKLNCNTSIEKKINEFKCEIIDSKTSILTENENFSNDANANLENNEQYIENTKILNTQTIRHSLENDISFSQVLPPQVEYYENKFDRGDYIHKTNFNTTIISGTNKQLDQENNSMSSITKFDDNTISNKPIKIDKGGSGEPYDNARSDVIQTPYEFTKAWQGIKDRNDLRSRADVIRRIQPENLQTVLGNKLDGPMFSSWLECLHLYFCTPSDVDVVEQYLNEIIHVPRFDIIVMFMNDTDKIAVKNLISFLNQHGKYVSNHVVEAFNAKF